MKYLLFTLLLVAAIAVPASAVTHVQNDEFTSSGIWLCPADVNNISLTLVGGGEGGSGGGFIYPEWGTGYGNRTSGVGGINGTILTITSVPVNPGQAYVITIGQQGHGGDIISDAAASFKNLGSYPATKTFNGTPGQNSTAFGYTATGGNANKVSVYSATNTSTLVFTQTAVSTGYNGYGTVALATAGGMEIGEAGCDEAWTSGYAGGYGYGAGGGGGQKGLFSATPCFGGQGGDGAAGYAKITYLTEQGTTTTWYSQQLVQVKIVDAYQVPIPMANVTARYIASSLPSQNASYLTAAFGISSAIAKDMVDSNVAMYGFTDNQGAISMMLFPAIRYGFWVENETLGVSNYVEISPKEEFYTIICPKTGQAASESKINNTYTTRLPFYQLNSTYYNLSMIFYDPDGRADNVVFTVYDHTAGDTVVYQKDWGDPNTDMIVDNYTAYVPFGQEYIWEYNATYTTGMT